MRTKGERLGPYELLSPIGAGGMGEVWKALDTRLRRVVAIKFQQVQFSARFEREARAIAALNHPNVAQIYDVGDDYIVMEFVDGAPIGHPGDARKSLDIAVQMADGLAAAHAAGFVHRDLKPANVLVSRDGRVKILDFGLAKRASEESGDEETAMLPLSSEGMVVGTAAYMSPEQARGQKVDFRTDQFSFGLVVYEMLSGHAAFRRPSAAETMTAIIREDAEPIPATTPAALRWIVERCLAKDPDQRYDSTRDLFRELRQIREHITEGHSGVQSAVSPRIGASRKALLAGSVLLLLAAGAATAWWATNRSSNSDAWIGTQLGGPGIALRPAISPDGKLLAFSAMVDGQTQLAVMNPDSKSWTVLTHDRSNGMEAQASWSPDGSRIYFDRVFGGPHGVYEISPLGGEPRLLLDSAQCPHALPDGSLIVVRIDQSGRYRLYHFWLDSGKLDALPAIAIGGVLETPDPLVQVVPNGRAVIYLGTPEDKPNGQPSWYALDLASLHSRPLKAQDVPRVFAVGASPDSRSALLISPVGDIWNIAAVPISDDGPPRTIISFPKPRNIYGINAAADGSVYFDYMMRPSSILQFDPSGKVLSQTAVSIEGGGLIPLGKDLFLIDHFESGKWRLKVFRAGVGSQDLLQSSEESSGPVAKVGSDSVAFLIGSPGKRNIAIATVRDGRVIKRFHFDASSVRSIAVTPDGNKLYFSDGDQIYTIGTSAGDGEKPIAVTKGASVAIDPTGKYLYIIRTETAPRPLVRMPLTGGPIETLAIPSQYTISDSPLSPGAVDASGRVVFEVDSPDSWFEQIGMIDPVRKTFVVIRPGFSGDMWQPAWESDGRIAAVGDGLESTLWRYRPRKKHSE
jgi:eukaryotic-like serine/threonine-protein kinase